MEPRNLLGSNAVTAVQKSRVCYCCQIFLGHLKLKLDFQEKLGKGFPGDNLHLAGDKSLGRGTLMSQTRFLRGSQKCDSKLHPHHYQHLFFNCQFCQYWCIICLHRAKCAMQGYSQRVSKSSIGIKTTGCYKGHINTATL